MIRSKVNIVLIVTTALLMFAVAVNHIIVQKFTCTIMDPNLILFYDISLIGAVCIHIFAVTFQEFLYQKNLDVLLGPENIIIHDKKKEISRKEIKLWRKKAQGPRKLKVVVK